MKALYRFGAAFLAAVLLAGCAANGETPAMQIAKAQTTAAPQATALPQASSTPQPTQTPAPTPEPTQAPTPTPQQGAPAPESTEAEESGAVDVDLTQMSATMIYAEVLNMVTSPADYVGKTIKMQGRMAVYEANPALGFDYFYSVVVPDATACCEQGINFVWDGHDTPDTLPAAGTEVTVTGVYAAYDLAGETDYHLLAQSVDEQK